MSHDYFDEPEYDPVDSDAETALRKAAEGMSATVLLPDHLLHTIAASISTRLHQSVMTSIEKSISKKLDGMVDEAMRKVIGERAEALVNDALEKPRQKTNEWGAPMGPPVMFSELIPGIVDSFLNAKVNDKGQSDPNYGKATRAGWMIAQAVREHVDPVTKKAVETVTTQARDLVSRKIAAFVSQEMVPAIEGKRS